MREKMSPPPPIPMHLLPSGWKSPDDSPRPLSLPHNLFARDRWVEIFIGRSFSRIYFAIVAEDIQMTQNLISYFMFIFGIFYLKIVRFLFSKFGLACEKNPQKTI